MIYYTENRSSLSVSACQTCQDMKQRQLHGAIVVFENDDLIDFPSGKSKEKMEIKEGKKKEFLTNLNALFNDGGGFMCLHVKNPHMLGAFEQSVNMAMADLVPDDTMFEDNFERHLKDKNHVIFRVIQNSRPLSTYSFNTKVSYDKGVENPTHGQMRYYLNRRWDDDGAVTSANTDGFKFRQGEEVEVPEGVFQESMHIQAKRIPNTYECQNERIRTFVTDFFNHREWGMYLPKYITAFSKLKRGGSILLGVSEHKDKVLKWTRVDQSEKNELLTLHKPEFDLWKDKDGLYFVATDSPEAKGNAQTVEFRCQGIVLTREEQEELSRCIKSKVKDEMLWEPVGESSTGSRTPGFQPPVEVHFLPVEGGPADLVVVEVVVRHYKGVAFWDGDGPTAYYVQTRNADGTFSLGIMSTEDWFEKCREGI